MARQVVGGGSKSAASNRVRPVGGYVGGAGPMPPNPTRVIKDSGKRAEFESGMVRDTADDKMQWHRISEGPMLGRWAMHLTNGAVKYPDLPDGSANWTLASGEAELRRFRESAFRHFMQWYLGDQDEDHAAAVYFNINGAEYVTQRMHHVP